MYYDEKLISMGIEGRVCSHLGLTRVSKRASACMPQST